MDVVVVVVGIKEAMNNGWTSFACCLSIIIMFAEEALLVHNAIHDDDEWVTLPDGSRWAIEINADNVRKCVVRGFPIMVHQTSNINKHQQTSSNIIKHHQTSSNIIKHHQTSSNINHVVDRSNSMHATATAGTKHPQTFQILANGS
jgi:hypothetical protein